MKRFLRFFVLSALLVSACSEGDVRVKGNSVTVCRNGNTIRLQVISPDIIRVSAAPGESITDRKSLVVVPQRGLTDFDVALNGDSLIVTTPELKALVCPDGSLSFFDQDGKLLAGGGRMSFRPTSVEGKDAFSVRTMFASSDDESFYGLGQQQSGEFDHKGRSEELYQYNTKVSVPFVVSTKGYGILFDAYSLSRWGNPEPYKQLGEIFTLFDKDGVEGALTGTYKTKDGNVLSRREDSPLFRE